MSNQDKHNRIFRKFIHFLPPEEHSELPNAVLIFLIKDSLFTKDGVQIEQIQQQIRKVFDLEFDIDELKNPIDSLLSTGEVLKKNNKFYLTADEKNRLEKVLESGKDQYYKFYEEVKVSFLEINPLFNSTDIDTLCSDFEIYINTLFAKIGAEAAHFIYPDTSTSPFGNITEPETIFEELPQRSKELTSFIRKNFPRVLSGFSPIQLKFLSDKLNSVFVYTLVSIDPECSAYLQKSISGYTLSLDTNFLYNLLGLDGAKLADSAKRLVEITIKFNFKLFVTPRTLEEFNTSLTNAEEFLRRHPLPTQDPQLLRAGASAVEEAIIKSYWQQYADEKIGLEEFLSFYKNINSYLKEYGIKISNHLVKTVKSQQDELDKIIEGVKMFAPSKNPFTAEHDAFHILLIRNIRREKEKTGVLDTKQWFLTNDRSLLRYEISLERKRKGYSAHCIQPEHLLQILRPLLPRSENFHESLIHFIAEHQRRDVSFITPSVVNEVLTRMDRYKIRPKEIAMKILTDAHFNRKIKSIKKVEDRSLEIDNELLRQAEDAIKEKDKALKCTQQIGKKNYILERETEKLRKFKNEVTNRRKKRTTISKWVAFIFIVIVSSILIGWGVYKTIIFLSLEEFSGISIIIIGLVVWFITLSVSLRILPSNHAHLIIKDVKVFSKLLNNFSNLFGKKD